MNDTLTLYNATAANMTIGPVDVSGSTQYSFQVSFSDATTTTVAFEVSNDNVRWGAIVLNPTSYYSGTSTNVYPFVNIPTRYVRLTTSGTVGSGVMTVTLTLK